MLSPHRVRAWVQVARGQPPLIAVPEDVEFSHGIPRVPAPLVGGSDADREGALGGVRVRGYEEAYQVVELVFRWGCNRIAVHGVICVVQVDPVALESFLSISYSE